MNNYRDIIKAPIITEKTSKLQMDDNVYTFKVDINAKKMEIKKAIENIFKVKVLKVNTVNVRAKAKRVGRYEGKTAKYKKAYVKLAEDSNLEF